MKFLLLVLPLFLMADVKKCVVCHGSNFEKAALGKSKIVSTLTVNEIEKGLLGYQDKTYGGPLKGLMFNQVKDLNRTQISELSKEVSALGGKK